MSPKGIRHEVIRMALQRRWYKLAPDDIDLATETTFRLSEDALSRARRCRSSSSNRPQGNDGAAALLVVEIANSSLRYDMGRKAALYASFGVRELWVIDAVRLTTRVFRGPSAEGYRDARDFGASDRLAPLIAPETFALRLDELEILMIGRAYCARRERSRAPASRRVRHLRSRPAA